MAKFTKVVLKPRFVEMNMPKDWHVLSLANIGNIVGGGTPSSLNSEYWNGDILWAVPTDITNLNTKFIDHTNRTITKQGLKESSAKLLSVNSILITSRATIGECAINTKPLATNQGFQNLYCNDNHNILFIFYMIKFYKNILLSLSYGTTFLEISKTEINKILLPLPKIKNEQQKIASILSNVDALIESTQKIIEKAERLKKGLMQQLLTRGIGHKKFKQVKWIFGKKIKIPEDWIVKTLNDLEIKSSSGGTPNRTNSKYYAGNIIWIKSGELKDNFINNSEEKITSEALINSSAKKFPIKTVLIAMYGATIGKTAILTKKCTTNQAICAIYPNEFFYEYYLQQFIIKNKHIIVTFGMGAGQPNINQEIIRKFKYVIPPLKEQQKIASILSGVDAYIQKNQVYKEKLERLKKGLMQNLLTGKMRVKT